MSKCASFFYYFKYISFICFLYATIILFPDLISSSMGICCFSLILIYSLVSFVMFLGKFKGEQYNSLNNFVLCFLHFYVCFVAYKYQSFGNVLDTNTAFFELNYFITSLCLFVLTVNKFILKSYDKVL